MNLGDRALALFLTKGGIHFSTYDVTSNSGDIY